MEAGLQNNCGVCISMRLRDFHSRVLLKSDFHHIVQPVKPYTSGLKVAPVRYPKRRKTSYSSPCFDWSLFSRSKIQPLYDTNRNRSMQKSPRLSSCLSQLNQRVQARLRMRVRWSGVTEGLSSRTDTDPS